MIPLALGAAVGVVGGDFAQKKLGTKLANVPYANVLVTTATVVVGIYIAHRFLGK